MREVDAQRVAALCGQLGYPSTEDEVAARFRQCSTACEPGRFVAEDPSRRVVGWIYVIERFLLQAEPAAEICGLVVDAPMRRKGIARLLVLEAERWARAHGLAEITVRTNVERPESPSFYRSIGFDLTKTSHKFRKRVPT